MKSDKCLKGLELQLYLHRPLKSVDQQDSVGVVSRRASGESAVKSFSLGVWEFIIKVSLIFGHGVATFVAA